MSKRKARKRQDKSEKKITETAESAPENAASPFARERKLWIIISSVLFITCVVCFMYAMNAQSKISDYDSNLVNCTMALDEAIQARDDMEVEKHKLQRRIDEMSLKNAGENSIPEKYIKQFHEKGVTRPVPIIQTDLIKKNSMIPYEPSGPNRFMRFGNRNEIFLLSHNRALAYFGDGTIFGWMFLEYDVRSSSDIRWKIIESYCPHYDK